MKVYVVTEGDYSDNHIVGIFSTKEKAWKYYNLHKEDDSRERYTSYYEPEEYELDNVEQATRCCVTALKNKGSWIFLISGVLDDCDTPCGHIYKVSGNRFWITVNFHPDREVMKKSAQDYFYKYLAKNENIL
jgi:hypothetical protein